jgi:hypothetical protein
MPVIENIRLYNTVKRQADRVYKTPSAYKSGWIVKTYKKRGGTYKNDHKPKLLKRWFQEEWGDIGGKSYPVYRPFKRITKKTPLTADEIDPKYAQQQIRRKQRIKNKGILPPFK